MGRMNRRQFAKIAGAAALAVPLAPLTANARGEPAIAWPQELAKKPETQPPQQAEAPRPRWMNAAVEGRGMSGEIVEQMIRSSSRAVIPAMSNAFRAAWMESSEVVWSALAWRRSLMPVRSVIH